MPKCSYAQRERLRSRKDAIEPEHTRRSNINHAMMAFNVCAVISDTYHAISDPLRSENGFQILPPLMLLFACPKRYQAYLSYRAYCLLLS